MGVVKTQTQLSKRSPFKGAKSMFAQLSNGAGEKKDAASRRVKRLPVNFIKQNP